MILIDKLLECYPRDFLQEKVSGFKKLSSSRESGYISLDDFAKKINLENISYTYDDFISDYPQYKNHKESKSIYSIQMKGKSINDLLKEFGCFDILNHFKKGYDYNTFKYKKMLDLINYFDIEIDDSNLFFEISGLNTLVYGLIDDIEIFKIKYKLDALIEFDREKNITFLSFQGLLADWIREVHLKK